MTDKEIIRALRCCEKEVCADGGLCPLFSDADCIVHLGEAAADLIERLTAENAKAEAERDAAIADLKISSGCASCKYHCSDPIFCRDCNKKQNCKCMSCSLGLTNWKWHGLPEAPEEGEKA
jgi:hypothetical protein